MVPVGSAPRPARGPSPRPARGALCADGDLASPTRTLLPSNTWAWDPDDTD